MLPSAKPLARLMASAGYAVETFASAREFLDRGHHQDTPGCVVLDIRMPGLSGLDLQQELKAFTPPLPIIFITGHGDIPTSVRAMKDGAVDFLTKPVNDRDLLSVVTQAIARNVEARERHAELRELQRRAASLTPREREVMVLVVRGRLNKQVAAELGTAEKTDQGPSRPRHRENGSRVARGTGPHGRKTGNVFHQGRIHYGASGVFHCAAAAP